MRWPKGAKQGDIIVDGTGKEGPLNQLNDPVSLSFDRLGNLYVVDGNNNRVQKYSIEKTN